MEFIWGLIVGVFMAAFILSRKFRAGVNAMIKAILKGLGRAFMEFRKWARTHGPYAEKAKKGKRK